MGPGALWRALQICDGVLSTAHIVVLGASATERLTALPELEPGVVHYRMGNHSEHPGPNALRLKCIDIASPSDAGLNAAIAAVLACSIPVVSPPRTGTWVPGGPPAGAVWALRTLSQFGSGVGDPCNRLAVDWTILSTGHAPTWYVERPDLGSLLVGDPARGPWRGGTEATFARVGPGEDGYPAPGWFHWV